MGTTAGTGTTAVVAPKADAGGGASNSAAKASTPGGRSAARSIGARGVNICFACSRDMGLGLARCGCRRSRRAQWMGTQERGDPLGEPVVNRCLGLHRRGRFDPRRVGRHAVVAEVRRLRRPNKVEGSVSTRGPGSRGRDVLAGDRQDRGRTSSGPGGAGTSGCALQLGRGTAGSTTALATVGIGAGEPSHPGRLFLM